MTAPGSLKPRRKPAASSRTQYAILGLLASGARSGYDLKREVAERIAHFWNESIGHLYPVLHSLLEQGLVTRSSETAGARPTRHVYAITDRGRKELETWLREPVVPTPPRLEILLKLYFGAHTEPEVLAAHVAAYRGERAHQLATLESVHAELAGKSEPPDVRYLGMTVRAGVHAAHAAIAWCDEVLAELGSSAKGTAER
jgi:DNA-binding PadR family transcriptional regulator